MDYLIWVESDGKWTATLKGQNGNANAGCPSVKPFNTKADAEAAIKSGEVDDRIVELANKANDYNDRLALRKTGHAGLVFKMSIEAVRKALATTNTN